MIVGGVKRVVGIVWIPPRPSRANISKGNHLEVFDELHVDRPVEKIAEHWEAKFAVEYYEVVSVPDVLTETSHVGGQGLIGEVLVVINRGLVVKCSIDPVVHASHVIDQFVLSKRTACRKSVRPNEIPMDACVVAIIEPDYNEIAGFFAYALVIFGKHFSSRADINVGLKLLRIVKDQFAPKSSKILCYIGVDETLVGDGQTDSLVIANYGSAPDTEDFVEWIA